MRARGAAVLLLVAALAGCGGSGGTGSGASCLASLEWHSASYVGVAAAQDVPRGRSLHGAVVPACRDTNQPSPIDRDMPVRIRAVRGVDPRVAVVTVARPYQLYVNDRERTGRTARTLVRRYARHG